jgi:hypothetical protein
MNFKRRFEMNTAMKRLLSLVLLYTVLVGSALGAPPATITYQGYLAHQEIRPRHCHSGLMLELEVFTVIPP